MSAAAPVGWGKIPGICEKIELMINPGEAALD
jgi:hypothetical protein